jgi:uncharacterized protein (TIRG00374 family)
MIMLVVGLAAAALAARVLLDGSDDLFTAVDTLPSVGVGWVVAAVLAEALSYLMWGAALAVVLRCGGGKIRPITLGAAALAGDAASYCLPAGFATTGVVMFQVLRRRQVDAAVAAWTFAVCTVFDISALTVLTIIAIQIFGDYGQIPGLQTVSITLLTTLALICIGYAALRQPAIRHRITRPLEDAALAIAQRGARAALGSPRWGGILRQVGSPIVNSCRDWVRQLRMVRLTPAAGAAAFAILMLCWVADIAVLALAFRALHTTPPWTGLFLAYCAGQIAASVPMTPGGIGIVEGGMTLTLIAFGGAQTITLAAVLLYRLVVYWACIPAGGLAWLVLQRTSRARVPPGKGLRTVEVEQPT